MIGVINGVFMQETFKVASTDDSIMLRQKDREVRTSRPGPGRGPPLGQEARSLQEFPSDWGGVGGEATSQGPGD